MIDVQRHVFDAVLRRSFPAFLARVFSTVSPGDEYLDNWHISAIAYQLERIERGENRRLIINVPPRSGKSIAVSIGWPCWLLGHHPTRRIICASYASELALNLARQCRMVMMSDWYRRVFPQTIISNRSAGNDFQTTRGGGRFSTSVGGTMTGRGGSIIIIDDPQKPVDARSAIERQNVIDWMGSTVATRLNNKNEDSMVLVMQRLHEEDLSGHLLERGGWYHLNLPAIATEDQAIAIADGVFYRRTAGVPLHPEREGAEVLRAQKVAMGSAEFSAQYQQQPVPAGGLFVKRHWLKRYDVVPEMQPGDKIVQAWDTATKDGIHNDYSVCVTALVRRDREVFILDVYRARLNFPDLLANVTRLARRWSANALLIEDAGSGSPLIATLQRAPIAGVPTPIRRKVTTDKVTRLAGETHRIEAGNLILPKEAPWLADFEYELLGFDKVKHDDQVDALVHLLTWTGEQAFRDGPGGMGFTVYGDDYWDDDIHSDSGDF